MLAQQLSRPPLGAAAARPAARQRGQRGVVCGAAQAAEASAQSGSKAPSGGKGEVYIGFDKGDYAPREGRKGRIVVDDLSKYPGKDEYAGGWAGGEVGLKEFVAAYEREKQLNAPSAAKPEAKAGRAPQPISKGADVIYVGFGKEELEARKRGEKGRTIKDDARKYPQRNEITGGFAGGEVGLGEFVKTGDVPIALGGGGKKQYSPLITAGVIALAATGGGLLLSAIEDLGTEVATGNIAGDGSAAAVGEAARAAPLDPNTKLLLEVAVVLVGLVGTVAGARALVSNVTRSIQTSASKLAVLGAFWLAVFVAAKFVLDSP